MNFVKRHAPAFVSGAGISLLAVFLLVERPPRTASDVLEPTPGPANHYPTQVWYGDDVAFSCNGCPPGSQYRIDKIELLKDKILAELALIPNTEGVQELVEWLPPSPGVNVPTSPFGAWAIPTAWTDAGVTVTTNPVANGFKNLLSTQVYAVTWTLKESNGAVETYDPHIYAHGGKRR